MFGNFTPPGTMLEEQSYDDYVFLVSELFFRPGSQLERVPIMALLVGASGELRSDPEPCLAAHLFNNAEQFFILLFRPCLGVLGLRFLFSIALADG